MIINNKSIVKQYFVLIGKVYNRQESGLPLALFRIFYSLVLFAEIFQLYYFKELIFDPIPFIREAIFDISPFLIIWLGSIILIILGLKTRTAAFINYIFTVIVIGLSFHKYPGVMYEYHVDTELITLAFVLIFLPVSRRLSLDNLIVKLKYSSMGNTYVPNYNVSSISYLLLTLVAGLIYFDSIFYKFASPMWMSGLGVWRPSSIPWATWLDLSFLLNQEYLIKTLGYMTLLFQVSYIFLIWVKKTKALFLLIGIGLHIGIFFAFPIPWFALGMVALYIGMLPEGFYTYFTKKFSKSMNNTLTFYYDENCPLCNRLKWIIEFFDYKNNIIFRSVQVYSQEEALLEKYNEEELLDNVYSVSKNGVIYSGIKTYREMFMRIWIFKPLGLLLYIYPVSYVGSKIYQYVAINRFQESCTQELCSVNVDQRIDIENVKILKSLSIKDINIFFVSIFIVFLVISQLILLQKSFLLQHVYAKVGYEGRYNIAQFSRNYQSAIYPYTGLMSHPVFMDFHFDNRTEIFALKYVPDEGEPYFLPIINEQGQASFYDTGRQWVNYSFRTMVNYRMFQQKIHRYIYFWAGKNKIDLSTMKFKVLRKQIKVPKQWQYNTLKNNLNATWVEISTITLKDGDLVFTDITSE